MFSFKPAPQRAAGRLLIAALLASASLVSWAQSSVTLYGIVDSGIVYQDKPVTGSGSKTSLTGGALSGSRIGFRGAEDLGGGNKAIFNLETGINLDDGTTTLGAFFGRLSFVGLTGPWGELTAGRQLTPFYKMASLPADPFNVGLMGCICALTNTNPRFNNSLNYLSPSFGGIRLQGFYQFSERTDGKHVDVAAAYDNGGPLYLGAGYYHTERFGTTASSRGSMATATYDFKTVKLYGTYQVTRSGANGVPGVTKILSNYDIARIAARVPFGAHSLLLQLGYADDKRKVGNTGANATHTAIGYLYTLSKRTTFYASMGKIRNQDGAQFSILDATTPAYGTFGVDFGIRHTF